MKPRSQDDNAVHVVELLGPPATGKTTLCRALHDVAPHLPEALHLLARRGPLPPSGPGRQLEAARELAVEVSASAAPLVLLDCGWLTLALYCLAQPGFDNSVETANAIGVSASASGVGYRGIIWLAGSPSLLGARVAADRTRSRPHLRENLALWSRQRLLLEHAAGRLPAGFVLLLDGNTTSGEARRAVIHWLSERNGKRVGLPTIIDAFLDSRGGSKP